MTTLKSWSNVRTSHPRTRSSTSSYRSSEVAPNIRTWPPPPQPPPPPPQGSESEQREDISATDQTKPNTISQKASVELHTSSAHSWLLPPSQPIELLSPSALSLSPGLDLSNTLRNIVYWPWEGDSQSGRRRWQNCVSVTLLKSTLRRSSWAPLF